MSYFFKLDTTNPKSKKFMHLKKDIENYKESRIEWKKDFDSNRDKSLTILRSSYAKYMFYVRDSYYEDVVDYY